MSNVKIAWLGMIFSGEVRHVGTVGAMAMAPCATQAMAAAGYGVENW